MSEITCARCGCEGVRAFVLGANFCVKCANSEDLYARIAQLEQRMDKPLPRLGDKTGKPIEIAEDTEPVLFVCWRARTLHQPTVNSALLPRLERRAWE